jgi:hypothetical protein
VDKRSQTSKRRRAEPADSKPQAPAEEQPRTEEEESAQPEILESRGVAEQESPSRAGQGEVVRQETAKAVASGQVPVTEEPVATEPVPTATQYVVTVDNQSGVATKVEKLDEKTGERKELSADEYAAMFSFATEISSLSSSAPGETFASDPLTEAYYQGVSDYLRALTPFG